jgi:hypothetical protein
MAPARVKARRLARLMPNTPATSPGLKINLSTRRIFPRRERWCSTTPTVLR